MAITHLIVILLHSFSRSGMIKFEVSPCCAREGSMTNQSKAFSRILIDEELTYSSWDLHDPH